MALDFPANPVEGEAFGSYIWSASKGVWQSREESATVAITSPTAPLTANNGDLWYNTSRGVTYIYYDDGSSSQWVEVVTSGTPELATKADLAYVNSQDNLKANLSGGNTFSGNQVFSSFISNPSVPAFYAQGSGTVVMSGAQRIEYIPFSNATTNVGGHFNTSNSRFTAPIAGTYYFWLQAVTTDATSTGPEILIFKNSSSVNNVAISYNSAFYNTFGAAYILTLQANDFVQHGVQNNNGTTFTLERGRSRFSGYLIG
jgi:hypothetical protein